MKLMIILFTLIFVGCKEEVVKRTRSCSYNDQVISCADYDRIMNGRGSVSQPNSNLVNVTSCIIIGFDGELSDDEAEQVNHDLFVNEVEAPTQLMRDHFLWKEIQYFWNDMSVPMNNTYVESFKGQRIILKNRKHFLMKLVGEQVDAFRFKLEERQGFVSFDQAHIAINCFEDQIEKAKLSKDGLLLEDIDEAY